MPKLQAKEIKLNEHEKTILNQMKKGTHTEQHLKKRSEIILRASAGESRRSISRSIKMEKGSVREWRNRYASANEEL